MKKLIALAACMLGTAAAAQVYVPGYVKRDGTYVAPHYRSAPNNSIYDNYSTKPNYNPYTGQRGTVSPYSVPSYTPPYVPRYTPPQTYTPPSYYTPPRSTQPPPSLLCKYSDIC